MKETTAFIPCNCAGSDHGVLFTYDPEDGDVYISILYRMFNKRSTFHGRLLMAWKTLRGTFYDDFVIVSHADLEEAVETIKRPSE